jgi:hypothetical protein
MVSCSRRGHLRRFAGTQRPSSRHSRRVRLRLICQPSSIRSLIGLGIAPARSTTREGFELSSESAIVLGDQLRADSGLENDKLMNTLARRGVQFSIGAKQNRTIRALVHQIPDSDWTAVADYSDGGEAQIAEIDHET